MTQATLSTEFDPTSGLAPPRDVRSGASSEAALWLFGITAATLVLASLLILGLVAQNALADAALSGFVSALALVVGIVGVVAMGYVVATAHRAGYLSLAEMPRLAASTFSADAAWVDDAPPPSSGLRVVPALPPDLSARRRHEVAAARDARAKQARAIAAADTARRSARPATPLVSPVRSRQVQVIRPVPSLRPTTGPVGRRSHSSPGPRPAARPSGVPPYLRMSTPPVHPQVRTTHFQVAVVDTRSPYMSGPWPMSRPLVARPMQPPISRVPKATVERPTPMPEPARSSWG